MAILAYFLIIIALIWIVAATISDLKKREVPDWLSFSLIAIALFARFIFSLLENDFSFFFWGIIYFGIFFLLGNLFYYTKVFAGGDAKLLMGIGAVLAEPPQLTDISGIFPLPLTFIANLFIIGSVYGLLLTFSYAYKNKEKFVKEFRKRKPEIKVGLFLTIAIAFILAAFLTKIYVLVAFSFMVIILPYFYTAVKVIEQVGMISMIPVKQLAEGDWLASPVRIGRKIIKPTWDGLTKKEIALLKKAKKKVLVKHGLPFVPAFLLTFIVTLLFGNLFEVLITLFF